MNINNTETVKVAPTLFTTKTYKHFVVKYMLSSKGNIVYQFFSENPESIEQDMIHDYPHQHVPFHPKFKDVLLAAFSKKISKPECLDTAFLHDYNSYSVIARGYADSIGASFILDDLFAAIDKEIDAASN